MSAFQAWGVLFAGLLAGLGLCPAPLLAEEAAAVVESESNDNPATADVIDLAGGRGLVLGSIGFAGDVDYYKITVAANARIWALVDTGGPQTGSDRDSVLSLLGTDGVTLIESDDNDGTGNGTDLFVESVLSSVIAGRQVGAGGTYFLQVKNDDTGIVSQYRLAVVIASTATLEVEPNGSFATATSLVTSTQRIAARNGAIADTDNENEADDDYDYYSIASTVGDTVFVAVDGDPNRDGTQTNVAFDLLDAAGKLLLQVDNSRDLDSDSGSNDDGFIGEGAHLIVATNPVYARVHGSSDPSEGSYRIMAASHSFPGTSGSFYTITPCRIWDTRTIPNGTMVSNIQRSFPAGGVCGIPLTATAAVFTFTVVNPSGPGTITVWPGDLPKPTTYTLGFPAGAVRSNNAIIGLSVDGFAHFAAEGTLTSGSTFHFVVDVSGYFIAN